MKERMLEINPDVKVEIHKCFFLPENADEFPFEDYDYIVDAVDTVTAKLELVMKAKEKGVPIISSMGAGNKLDPTMFRVADIYKTKVCPLAKVMRRELKKRGVKKLKVVYSEEQPTRPINDMAISCRNHCICPPGAAHKCTERRDIPGSTAFVPSVVGLIIAGEAAEQSHKQQNGCDQQAREQLQTLKSIVFYPEHPQDRGSVEQNRGLKMVFRALHPVSPLFQMPIHKVTDQFFDRRLLEHIVCMLRTLQ